MFGKMHFQWIAGPALMLAMAPTLVGVGTASAQSLAGNLSVTNATSTMQLTANGNTTVAAGTILTITGSGYGADEAVSFWINVPNGTTISEDSLGQSDSEIV